MIYLVFLAFHYWSIALWRLGRSRFFADMPFLVGAILLFVRNSGTDVEAYEQIRRYLAKSRKPRSYRKLFSWKNHKKLIGLLEGGCEEN